MPYLSPWNLHWFWWEYSPAIVIVLLEVAVGCRERIRASRQGAALAIQHTHHPTPWPAPILWWGFATSVAQILSYEALGSADFVSYQVVVCVGSLGWLVVILALQAFAYVIRFGLCRPHLSFLWVLPILIELFDASFVAYTAAMFDMHDLSSGCQRMLEIDRMFRN